MNPVLQHMVKGLSASPVESAMCTEHTVLHVATIECNHVVTGSTCPEFRTVCSHVATLCLRGCPLMSGGALGLFLMRGHCRSAQLDGPAAQPVAPASTHTPLEEPGVATVDGLLAALATHVTSAATVQVRQLSLHPYP